MKANRIYPFSAIVGQERMKRALILNAIHPGIGGVLIRGEKGTAKSTAVRALATLLPEIAVMEGCPYSCDPSHPDELCDVCRRNSSRRLTSRRVRVVNLPLNATEDRLIGGMDFEAAIRSGNPRFQPGLFAEAHRGILYVDEVNLLDDHLVDVLLDVSASGENVVEREGLSFRHPARFILVGTMNPEEGELRPQFLDRFGLCVGVSGAEDPEERVLLMERREAFDTDAPEFDVLYREENEKLATSVATARNLLTSVRMDRSLRQFISELCMENNVAGHRADLIIERTAAAIAALDGRVETTPEDIREAAELALPHRQRAAAPPPPAEQPPPRNEHKHQNPERNPDQEKEEQKSQEPNPVSERAGNESSPEREGESGSEEKQNDIQETQSVQERIFEVGETFKVRRIHRRKDRVLRRGSGRRNRTRTSQKQGRYVKSTMRQERGDLALDATLRAAAPHQARRPRHPRLAVTIRSRDIREKVREKRVGSFLLFIVDASGSMGAQGRMAAAKGAVMSLLLDAYQKRDRVAMIAFRKREAQLMLPPTSSIDLAGKLLRDLPVGGRTPLSAGLIKGYETLRNHLLKDPSAQPIAVLITDGKTNVALNEENPPLGESLGIASHMALDERIKFIVVDTEQSGFVRFGLALRLAEALRGDYFKIDDLRAENLVSIVRSHFS